MIRFDRIMRGTGYVLLAFVGLATLGAVLPSLPILGMIGPLLVGPFGSWIVLLGIVGAIACVMRWRRSRRRIPLVIAGVAAFAAVGSGFVAARQIAVARANGIAIDLAATLVGPATAATATPASYRAADGRTLPLLVYRSTAAAAQRRPVLVYVHGGGWGAGTIQDRARDMRWFAERGYLVVSVGYTLADDGVHTWDIAEGQVACALGWVGANAARLGGDANRIALFGESAGGNLVINVSYKAAAGTLRAGCPAALPRIAATIAPYPVLDAVAMYRNGDAIAGYFGRMMTTRYTGGTPAQFPARYAAISPTGQVVRAAPPTLLFPAAADHLLPIASAEAFAARARAAGIDVRMIVMPHAEHSFDLRNGSIGSQIVRTGTLQFLAQHELPPLNPQS